MPCEGCSTFLYQPVGKKPAHTFYGLQLSTRTMRLVSTDLQQRETTADYTPPLLVLGSNTLLGTENRRL